MFLSVCIQYFYTLVVYSKENVTKSFTWMYIKLNQYIDIKDYATAINVFVLMEIIQE